MKPISELGLELIELEDQVLLVDRKSRIRNGDFILGGADDESFHEIWVMDDHFISEEDCKVIASTKKLEGLPLLVIEDELSEHEIFMIKAGVSRDDIINWKKGYSRAKEIYKFTEEDLRNALSESFKASQEGYQITSDEIIQSLTKKELWIEVELSLIKESHKTGYTVEKLVPKVVNNQIKAVWK